MAGDWEALQLRDACLKIGSGATPRGGKEAYKGGATSLIRSQNIYNEGFHRDGLVYIDEDQSAELRNVEVKPNDVLLNITGDSVARCCQVAADVLPARVNQHVAIIRPRPDSLDARFLRYVLVSHEYQQRLLALASAGATRPALTKTMIEELDIPSPPLAEQKAIAAVLGALDDKIELNRRINATLEAMARALFQSWFVDFDPVRANMDRRGQKKSETGRVKSEIGPASDISNFKFQSSFFLPPATAALFPSLFQESAAGHIPFGWEVKTLADLASLITKGTTPTQDDITTATDTDVKINYVRVNSIDEDGSILPEKLTTIPESVHAGVLKRSILKADDVLYTIAGTIGRIALAEDWILPANTNQAVAIIRREPAIPPGFLILTMRHEAFREELHHNIVHAVQANLSLGMLSKARIVVPPETILKKLFAPIDEILRKISANRTQSRTLATLRDTLLPKLLSGELNVKQLGLTE